MSKHVRADGLVRRLNSELTALAYSIPEAAARISLSRSRLYELIASGEIAFVEIGTRTVICEDDLRAFLDRHRIEPAPICDGGQNQRIGINDSRLQAQRSPQAETG